jgi:hypothetical protein
MVRTMIVIEPDIRAERRLRARSPRTVSVTYCDGPCGPGLGCRGTTRGTSTGRIPAQCVLSVRPRVASVPVERSWRSTGPLLIRGFRIRAPGASLSHRKQNKLPTMRGPHLVGSAISPRADRPVLERSAGRGLGVRQAVSVMCCSPDRVGRLAIADLQSDAAGMVRRGCSHSEPRG